MCSSGTADQLHRDYEDLITNSSILHLDDLNLFEHVYSRLSKKLLRDEHCSYLRRGSLGLGPAFTGLDASQPWLCYWISHTYRLLGRDFDVSGTKIADKISQCYNDGGYGGGLGQLAHLASTYAAICTLITIGDEYALEKIDRSSLYAFLLSLKNADGSFVMHKDGEVDVRGSYCAIAVASLCNILTPELEENVAEFIHSCQTYEGGIGGSPWSEAHGGYTYCAVATLSILNALDKIDARNLLNWLVKRQMSVEGGFNGRTNKLVDGCYSFWQASTFPLIIGHLNSSDQIAENFINTALFNADTLNGFILNCTQKDTGGCTDRYDRSADYYHTCYCLSGMAVTLQETFVKPGTEEVIRYPDAPETNTLEMVHPLYNISLRKYVDCRKYFIQMPDISNKYRL